MKTLIRLLSTLALALTLSVFTALQGCAVRNLRSTTPAGAQTASGFSLPGFSYDNVVNDSEAAYRTCLEAQNDTAAAPGFNNAEAYCFNRTSFGSALMGSPYYNQFFGAFTGAWNPGFNPMGAPIPSPAFGGGRWVMTPSGPRYMPGGMSTTQGTALDPMMAPAVVGMDAQRTGAMDATTIEQGLAIAAYPVQGSLSAPSRRAVSQLSPDALADLQRRVDTMQRTVLRLSRGSRAR